ncbi:DUF5956 family protein [Arthrobacter antibioticus]|uniref:DUF5956 family protein n=1 Tax=Arthrobacter sp. H35-MC1 TaxID=3046203 RepID=UPI0024BA11CF|nr:DUF5956 family protein [Arthrobacter sp. H35-MC1]MDJ0318502.1 DUF5956 family protein [Arthrobacter sp. H35-MC1]
MWDEVQPRDCEQGWELLPESGWFALMAWTAGPDNLSRSAQEDAEKKVRVMQVLHEVESHTAAPFTAKDRHTVNEAVNEFLLDAGVAARPPGFDWFLRLPQGWPVGISLAEELGSQITLAWENGTHPAKLRPLFHRVVQDFYATAPR